VSDPRPPRNRARLREALLGKLGEAPFEQISIRELTMAAGLSYTSFFRLYETREALIADLAVEAVRELYDLTVDLYFTHDKLTRCRAICDHVDQRWTPWSALLAGAATYIRGEMIRLATETLADRPEGPVPKELTASIGVNTLVDVLIWWSRQDVRPSRDTVADILMLVLLPRV
jgi:AcrR family transcriptional regulator